MADCLYTNSSSIRPLVIRPLDGSKKWGELLNQFQRLSFCNSVESQLPIIGDLLWLVDRSYLDTFNGLKKAVLLKLRSALFFNKDKIFTDSQIEVLIDVAKRLSSVSYSSSDFKSNMFDLSDSGLVNVERGYFR